MQGPTTASRGAIISFQAPLNGQGQAEALLFYYAFPLIIEELIEKTFKWFRIVLTVESQQISWKG